MYIIKSEAAFDSAHFLKGYSGKCSNIHGHRWRITASVCGEALLTDTQHSGMLADFGDLKKDLRKIADGLDHSLIYEENTLMSATEKAFADEGFKTVILPFRPTAENLSRYIFDKLSELGYNVLETAVYETPENCAVYRKSDNEGAKL